MRTYQRTAHYVRQVEAEAGDLIIFTEALVHGTMEWTAEHERRSLLYKFSPGHSSWASTYYDTADYRDRAATAHVGAAVRWPAARYGGDR